MRSIDSPSLASPVELENDIIEAKSGAVQENTSVILKLSFIDRFLSLWIISTMILGVITGYYSPTAPQAFRTSKVLNVSLPVAFGLWFMMWPVLVKVKYEAFGALFRLRETWKQIAFSMISNWVSYCYI